MCLYLGFDQRIVVDVCRGDDFFFNGFAPVMIFLIGGVGFKSVVWVSDRWLGFADWWLGFADWWPLLAPTGLMVCVCVALLMVCVCVCVALCVW